MIPVRVTTSIPGPQSQKLITNAFSVISRAQYAGLFGIALTSGKGIYVTDADGNTFLDFLGGASAACLGYGREDLIKTYAETARKMQHSCFAYSPNEETVKFANKLIQVTPGSHDKRVLFGLTGSDSVDAAIKIAQRYTGKPVILSFKGGYHGSTGFSIAANGFSGLQQGLYLGENFILCDFPRTDLEAINTLEQVESHLKKGDVAGLIIETIQGDGGNVVAPPHFHKQLHDLVKSYDAVHIVDEVQSGVGRSGKWWEIQHFDIIPDILCAGKALASGFAPISACVARAEMSESLGKAQHLFTFSGHPPTTAVALKVFEIIENEKYIENAAARGNQLVEGLNLLIDKYPFAKEVRGRGLHIGFEVYDDDRKIPLGGLFAFRSAEKGLYPGYFGSNNEVMRLHPPLIVSEEEVAFAIDVISEVAEEWFSGNFPKTTIENYRKFAVGLGSD